MVDFLPTVLGALLLPTFSLSTGWWATRYKTKQSKRLMHHAAIREALKESSEAVKALDHLLEAEAKDFQLKEEYLLRRAFSFGNLLFGVVFIFFAAAAGAVLLSWALASWGTFWAVIALVALFAAMFVLPGIASVGLSKMYSDPQQVQA